MTHTVTLYFTQLGGGEGELRHLARANISKAGHLMMGPLLMQGLMYTYALGVDRLERKAAENFALYFRRRQADCLPKLTCRC